MSKGDYKALQNQINTSVQGLERNIMDIGNFRNTLEGWRTAPRTAQEQAQAKYSQLAEGTTGYAPSILAMMRSRITDTTAGERQNYAKNIGQRLAAMGMRGNSGTLIRNLNQQINESNVANRAGLRDIDIANAERAASNQQLGLSGLMSSQGLTDAFNQANYGMQQNTYNQVQNAIQGQNALYGTQLQNVIQKNKPGFWGTLGSSFASGLGSGLGTFFSPVKA